MATVTGELAHINPAHVSEQSLLGLLYLIGPGSLLALTCYVIALRRLPTAAVSTYAYINPVVAVSLGALFLSERPTSATLLGGAVVVVAVAMLLTSRQANRKLDQAPSRARSPFGPGQRVLDLAALGAFDDVGSLVRDRADHGEAAFLHDAERCAIGRHRAREHPLDAKVGEPHADEGTRPLGGVALVPRGPAQPVTEVDVAGIGVAAGARAEVQPAQKLPGGGALGRPGPEPVEPVVTGQVEGDDLVPDLFAGYWPAAGEVAHYLGVAVQLVQVVNVVLSELAYGQSRCFQDDWHEASIPMLSGLFWYFLANADVSASERQELLPRNAATWPFRISQP
jgi:hypothetical protein